jgi:hypothetical protein
MRLTYARNAGRPWAVRILIDGTEPRAPRRAQSLSFDTPTPRAPAPTRV